MGENSKTGLVGNHLRIANVGSFSPSVSMGFELIAFSPVFPSTSVNGAANTFVTCEFSEPFADSYIAGCSQGCSKFSTLFDAKRSCIQAGDCNGITIKNGKFELRSSKATSASPYGETSWLLMNGDICTSLRNFSDVVEDTYVAACSQGCEHHVQLDDAKTACAAVADCAGITQRADGHYELRHSNYTSASTSGESSWLLTNAMECHSVTPPPTPSPSPPLPRQPNVNYDPGIFVRFREQTNESFGFFSYFYVSNNTQREVEAEEFYSKIIEYKGFYSDVMSAGMDVKLPAADRRHADMAKSVLLSAWGNYVGD